MQQSKIKYSLVDFFVELKVELIISLLIWFVLIVADYRNMLDTYFVLLLLAFLIYVVVANIHKFKKVANYITTNESEINKRHGISDGYGYNYYYRNLNTDEIKKLVNSSVKDEFISCYNFPLKLLYIFIVASVEYVVFALRG